jgi:hypothetical protein
MANASNIVTTVFGPPLKAVLEPVNHFLAVHYLPWSTLCAMALFAGAVVWVWTLKKEYVNVDAPRQGFWFDLRVWTVLCLLPHVVVYLYFAKWS